MLARVLAALTVAAALLAAGPAVAQDSTKPFMVRSYPAPAESLAAAEAAARAEALSKVLRRLGAERWSEAARAAVKDGAEQFLTVMGRRYTEPNAQGLYEPVIFFKAEPAKAQAIAESVRQADLKALGRPQLAVALTICYRRGDGPCQKTADTPAWETALNRAVERVLRDSGFDLPQLPPSFLQALHSARDIHDIWPLVEGKVQFALIGRAVVDETQVRERRAASGYAAPATLNAKFLNLNASSGGAVAVQDTETGTGTTVKAAIARAMETLAQDSIRTVAVSEVIAAWTQQAEAGVPVDVAFVLQDEPGLRPAVERNLAGIAEPRGCTGDDQAGVSCYRLTGAGALTNPVARLQEAAVGGVQVCRLSRNRQRYYLFTDQPGRFCAGAGQMQAVALDYGDMILRYCGDRRGDWASGADRALAFSPELGDCGGSYDLGAGDRCRKALTLDEGRDPLQAINKALRLGREMGHYEAKLTAAYAAESGPARRIVVIGQSPDCFE